MVFSPPQEIKADCDCPMGKAIQEIPVSSYTPVILLVVLFVGYLLLVRAK